MDALTTLECYRDNFESGKGGLKAYVLCMGHDTARMTRMARMARMAE